jgi:hypothetical protein
MLIAAIDSNAEVNSFRIEAFSQAIQPLLPARADE